MEQPILSTVHRAAGAHLGHGGDPQAVASYGDPAAELLAIRQDCALLDETARGAVRCEGRDAVGFLQRLLAGDVSGLGVGDAQRNLLLSSKGRVLHLFELCRLAEHQLLALTEPGGAAGLCTALETYHFSEDLELVDATGEHAPLALLGPRAEAILARLLPGAELPGTNRAARLEHAGTALLVLRHRRHGAPGFLVDAGPERAAALWSDLLEVGARPVGQLAREASRIAAGEALAGTDVDPACYPQEARLEDAFSLAKGCYVGQEVVAKIDTYGGLHRRLVVLELDSDQAVDPRSPIRELESGEQREVGRVSSSSPHPSGRALALGFVKLEYERPGTALAVGDAALAARVIASSG